jgi:L-lactate dehydrogenase complex protein LldG
MATSRDTILNKLRAAHQPYPDIEPLHHYLPVVPITDISDEGLVHRFVEQAEKLGSVVHRTSSEVEAINTIFDLVRDDNCVLSWSFEHISLPSLAATFEARNIKVADPRDPTIRVGITGADGALAATGSLVLITGEGKYRATSLLPLVHIAIVRSSQILLDLESWVALQRKRRLDEFREISSVVLISGPSRTADIAMQLIMGMHGPAELHIVLIKS